jgi:hypothetical protein
LFIAWEENIKCCQTKDLFKKMSHKRGKKKDEQASTLNNLTLTTLM